jgi:WD40 repeat protein/ankyrin repeat protein
MRTYRVFYASAGIVLVILTLVLSGFPLPEVQALAVTPTPTLDVNAFVGQIEEQTAEGLYDLGLAYYQGTEGEPDYEMALALFTQAADKGSIEAMFALGVMYENGQGTPVNMDEAVQWYVRASEGGSAQAQYWLGQLYFWGSKVPKDYEQAELWLTPAAEQNHVDAQYVLGLLYTMRSQDPLAKKPTDVFDSYKWLALAEINGHEKAATALAIPEPQLDANQLAEAEIFIVAVLHSVDNEGLTPVYKAAVAGNVTAVENLLRYDVDINTGSPETGFTPLHIAAGFGHTEIVERLLEAGADATARNVAAITPLHVSANGDIAEMLIAAGADVNALDGDGLSPLDWAVWKEHYDVIEVLVDHDAISGKMTSDIQPAVTPTPFPEPTEAIVSDEGRVADRIGQFEKLTWLGPFTMPDVAWSPDSTTLAILEYLEGIELFDTSSLEAEPRLVEDDLPAGSIDAIFFSPDGTLMSITGALRAGTTGGPHPFTIWDMATKTPIVELDASIEFQHYRALSRDGAVLAIGQDDGTIWLWSLRDPVVSGEPFRIVEAQPGTTRQLALSPDGTLLAAGGLGDHFVWVWDTTTGEQVAQLQGSVSGILAVAFSPDGATLAIGDYDGVTIWDTQTFSQVRTLRFSDFLQMVDALAFSPDGSVIAVAVGATVDLWDSQTGERLGKLDVAPAQEINALAFRPDGNMLAAVTGPGYNVTIWGLPELQPAAASGEGTTSLYPITAANAAHLDQVSRLELTGVVSVAWHPIYPSVFVASTYSQVAVYAPPDLLDQIVLPEYGGSVSDVIFTPDGSQLIFGGSSVRVVDVTTGRIRREFESVNEGGLALSPDGRVLAFSRGSESGYELALWDMIDWQSLEALETDAELHRALAFSPDGAFLASADDEVVKIWDMTSRENVATLNAEEGVEFPIPWHVQDMAFSPDGSLLAAGAWSGLTLWDTSTWTLVAELESPDGRSHSADEVAFSPDGSLLVSADYDTLFLWDVTSRRNLATLDVQAQLGNPVVAFNSNGTLLATGGEVLRLWGVTEVGSAPAEPPAAETEDETSLPETDETAAGLILFAAPSYVFEGSEFGRLALSPGGQWLALADTVECTVQLRDTRTGEISHSFELGQGTVCGAMAFSPDGTILAAGTEEGGIRLLNPADGTQIAYLLGPNPTHNPLNQIVFSSNGQTIAALDYDTIHLWDIASGDSLAKLDGTDAIEIGFSPDGSILISLSRQAVTLWDTATGDRLEAREGNFNDSSLSLDGTALAYKSQEKVVEIRDPITWEEQARLENDSSWLISRLALNRDGSILATVHRDQGVIRLWDLATGANITELEYASAVNLWALAFSPNGAVLAAAGYDDAKVSVWILDPTALSEPAPQAVPPSSDAASPGVSESTGPTQSYETSFGLVFDYPAAFTIEEMQVGSDSVTVFLTDPAETSPYGLVVFDPAKVADSFGTVTEPTAILDLFLEHGGLAPTMAVSSISQSMIGDRSAALLYASDETMEQIVIILELEDNRPTIVIALAWGNMAEFQSVLDSIVNSLRLTSSVSDEATLESSAPVRFPPGFVGAGHRIEDPSGDVSESYLDVIGFTVNLDGETLEAVFELRDLPDELVFDREGMEEDVLEYRWTVDVYLDPSHEQPDYTLEATRFARGGSPFSSKIEEQLHAGVWTCSADGSCSRVDSGSIAVDYDANTIILRGEIPGITNDALFSFEAYDRLAHPQADVLN